MNKIRNIIYRQISRISPSQFHSMKNCSYKLVLAEAFDKKYLLPMPPNAYMGSMIHKLLEEIAKNEIKTEGDLNMRFAQELQATEEKLVKDGYGFYVPMQNSVNDFGIKQLQLKKHLRNWITTPNDSVIYGTKYISEKWFQTDDGILSGRIDLIILENNKAEIIDFKTGAITKEELDDEGEVRNEIMDEHKDQLRLYAFLYFSETSKFPEKLSLVDLSKQKYNVEFTKEECLLLFEEVKNLLKKVNNDISKNQFNTLANPSVQNCKFCLFRPACSYYLDYLHSESAFNDLSGEVTAITKYLNGNTSIEISCNGKTLSVTGFSESKFPYLIHCKNKILNIFNLKKNATGNSYTVSKATTIYE